MPGRIYVHKLQNKCGRDIVSHSSKSALISTDSIIRLLHDKVYRRDAIILSSLEYRGARNIPGV